VRTIFLASAVMVFLGGFTRADARMSTAQERQDFVKTVKLLEEDPLNDKAATLRAWAANWLDECEDIEVIVTVDLLVPVLHSKEEESQSIIVAQFVFACGVYAIEKGKKDQQDLVERNVRALESTVKMYRNLIKGHPENEVKGMAQLVKAVDEKRVVEYVKKILAEGPQAEDGEKK
jgi:hypothetical protein